MMKHCIPLFEETKRSHLISFFQQGLSSQKIEWEVPYRLLFSSSKCDKDGVILELEKGVETNQADYDKRTALHLASCEGCTEIVHLLLEKGADVNIRDRWGRTVSAMLYKVISHNHHDSQFLIACSIFSL